VATGPRRSGIATHHNPRAQPPLDTRHTPRAQSPTDTPPTDPPPVPRADLAVAAAAVILAAVALVASSLQPGFAPLITLTLTPPGIAPTENDSGMLIVVTPTPVVLPGIRMGAAIATLLLFVAAMRLLLLVPAVRRRHATDAAADRHTWRWIEYSQLAGVGTFLVAQLNGITEVTSLVPIYALGAAGALFLIVHDHRAATGRFGGPAFALGSAVAIVPWGVIAFAQITTLIAGVEIAASVRVVTLLALVASASVWVVTGWRARRDPERTDGCRTDALLGAVLPLAPAGLVLSTLWVG